MAENLSTPVDIKVDTTKMAEEWAGYVIERWWEALDKYDIGKLDGALWSSFIKELQKADGNVNAVVFKFLKYGRFVDMGVGRGQSINGIVLNRKFDRYRNVEGKMVGTLARKKKPWYTKTFYREVAKLKELYQDTYSEQILSIMETNLTATLTLNP